MCLPVMDCIVVGLCTNIHHLHSGIQYPTTPCSYLSVQQNGAIEPGANTWMLAELTETLAGSHMNG